MIVYSNLEEKLPLLKCDVAFLLFRSQELVPMQRKWLRLVRPPVPAARPDLAAPEEDPREEEDGQPRLQ